MYSVTLSSVHLYPAQSDFSTYVLSDIVFSVNMYRANLFHQYRYTSYTDFSTPVPSLGTHALSH